MSPRPPPDWTLTGVELQWPDGQQTVVAQSAWRPTEMGWTCSIALRRTSPAHYSHVVPLDVHVTDEALSRETDASGLWIRARELVTEQLRNCASNDLMAARLGEVMIK
jgi:hypothetical protein